MNNLLPTHTKCVIVNKYIEDLNENNIQDALKMEEKFPLPLLKKDGVYVKIYAASINPIDWKMVKGFTKQIMHSPPWIPGFDFAGEVICIGRNVKQFRTGDYVYGMCFFRDVGAFSEYVQIPEKYLSIMPRDMSFIEAASIPLAGLTSYRALFNRALLKNGEKILILGGSSGTGTLAVQMAKAVGAEVHATCSQRNIDLVKSLGATNCVDYRNENWWDIYNDKSFDIIFDCIGGAESWKNCHDTLKPKVGRFVTIAGDEQKGMNIPQLLKTGGQIANRKFWSLFGYTKYDYFSNAPSGEILNDIRSLINQGKIKAVVEKVFDFDDYLNFYRHSMSGHTVGKIVLVIKPEKAKLKNVQE